MAREPLGLALAAVFAKLGDKIEFPAFEDGWDSDYSNPTASKYPERTAFNDLFAKLTSIGLDVNKYGAALPWTVSLDYEAAAIVTGTTGVVYSAIVPNTGIDPDNPITWGVTWQLVSSTAVVAELPPVGQQGIFYILLSAVDLFPAGIYALGGTGWVCQAQLAPLAVDWVGTEDREYAAGVRYDVTIQGDVTTFNITLTNNGDCHFVIDNSGGFIVPNPTTGKKRSGDGLNSLDALSVELLVSRTSIGNVYSAIELVDV